MQLSRSKQPWIALTVIVLGTVFGYFVFDYKAGQALEGPTSNKTVEGSSETKSNFQIEVSGEDKKISALVTKVAYHIFLPNGKVTVATVQDAEGLRQEDPLFYQLAKNGHKVLIYPDRKILYDPVSDIVLDVVHLK